MKENFPRCLAFTRQEEGGNSDDPHDHGGRTSRGIIQRVYDAYRHSKKLELADVWKAADAEVDEIYLLQYWNPYCDSLPSGLDLAFFDFCVNAGRTQAVRSLQRAVRVTPDGMFGIRTKSAIDKTADLSKLIHDYSNQRRAFYRSLKQFSRYGKGWKI